MLQESEGYVLEMYIHFKCKGIKDVLQWLREDTTDCSCCGKTYSPFKLFSSKEHAGIVSDRIQKEVDTQNQIPEEFKFR